MSPNARLLFTTFVAAVLGAGCATASTTVSVTSASYTPWEASNPGAVDLNFLSIVNGSQNPFTLGGFTFAGSGMVEHSNDVIATSIGVTAPSGGETSMAIYLGNVSGYTNATSFTLTFSDGSTASLSPLGLYAISSSTPIDSFTVTGNSAIGIADLWYAPVTQTQNQDPTPEAATVILTSGGLLILLGSGQRLMQKRIP